MANLAYLIGSLSSREVLLVDPAGASTRCSIRRSRTACA
jgi:hypothetical protein